jgi:cytochrome c-type biogenesis protein CcmF
MRNPGIAKSFVKDIYIEPQALFEADPEGGKRFAFIKGQTFEYAGYQVTFVDYEMNNAPGSTAFRIGGIFRVEKYGDEAQELKASRVTGPDGAESTPGVTAAGDLQVDIISMTPNQENLALSQIEVRMKNPNVHVDPTDLRETLVAQITFEPFISIVWIGIILMVIGFLVARTRRAGEARKLEDYEIPAEVRKAALSGDQGRSETETSSEKETVDIE